MNLAWLLGFVAFTILSTRNEFPGLAEGPAIAFLMRLAALVLLIALAMSRKARPTKTFRFPLAAALAFIILAPNILDLRPFAIMGAGACLLGLYSSSLVGPKTIKPIVKIIDAYLLLNVLSLAVAYAYYVATGGYYDIHHLVFPWSASRVGEFIGVPRPSGIQVEPGTYANAVFTTVFIRALITRKVATPVTAIAIVSTLGTNAAWAVIAVAGFLAAALFEQQKAAGRSKRFAQMAIKAVSLAGAAVASFWYLSDEARVTYYLQRFSFAEGGGSGTYKAEALTAWRDTLGPDMMLPRGLGDTFCATCLSIQDLGIGFNILYFLGLLVGGALLVAALLLLWKRFSFSHMLMFAPILLTKYYFYDPVIWICFGLIFFQAPVYVEVRKKRPSPYPAYGAA